MAPITKTKTPTGWQMRAACRGPQSLVFFPPARGERRDERVAREERAKEICAGCVVRAECLDFALSVREMHGIWGGLTETERRDLAPSPSARAPSA